MTDKNWLFDIQRFQNCDYVVRQLIGVVILWVRGQDRREANTSTGYSIDMVIASKLRSEGIKVMRGTRETGQENEGRPAATLIQYLQLDTICHGDELRMMRRCIRCR